MTPKRQQLSADPVIRVEQLAAAYDDQLVFRNVSFEVQRGEIFFVAGNSGCGKSTLLKQLIGLQPIAEGTVRVLEHDVSRKQNKQGQSFHRDFGVAFQGGALFGSRSVIENVRLPLEEFTSLPAALMDFIALTKLRLVGLENAAHKLPAELSGGMQKRAAIARAIALDPEIVFLDEPSAGLDPLTSADLDALLRELNRNMGTTFFIVSHELASIFTLAHRVAVLDASRQTLIAIDNPAALRDQSQDPWVRSFFHRESLDNHRMGGFS